MAVFLIDKFLQWSPLIQVLVLMIGTFLSFSVALSRGDVNFYLPFISETGAYSPEMCIFSLFLILGSFIGCTMIFFRFLILSQSSYGEHALFSKVNSISCFIGVLSMIGLAGVAAFPMTTVFWAHLLSAAVYFTGSAVYFICDTFLTFKKEGASRLLKFRFALCVIIMMLLFLLVICFPIAFKRWHALNKGVPALKLPENQGFTLIFISSLLEWSIVIIVVLYTLSLVGELKKHCLMMTVAPSKYKEDSVNQGNQTVEVNAPS